MVETLAGASSIRAFGLQKQFLQAFQSKVDGMNAAYYSLMISTQWLGLVLDLLGVGVMISTVVTIIAERSTFNYGTPHPPPVSTMFSLLFSLSLSFCSVCFDIILRRSCRSRHHVRHKSPICSQLFRVSIHAN